MIHERYRLFILTALVKNDVLAWSDLKKLYQDVSDGNLQVHTKKLVSEGYVSRKKFLDKRNIPRSEFRITPFGRRALEQYLEHMRAIADAVKT